MTVWQQYVLVRKSVYGCNVYFVKTSRSNVKLFWIVSCLDTCVLPVSQVSNIFTMSHSRLVSTKSKMSWLVSCLDTSVLANVSVSEKKCLDSITVTRQYNLVPVNRR